MIYCFDISILANCHGDLFMLNKLDFQKNLYKIFFIVTSVLTACGIALTTVLYYLYYDESIGMFDRNGIFTLYYVLGALAIVAAVVMSFAPCFSLASKVLPKANGADILINSFCGFFIVAYIVLEFLRLNELSSGISVWFMIMALCAVVGSLYFLYQTVSSKPNSATMAIFGMFMVVFIIINIYAVHYTAKDILLNSSTRIGSLVAMAAIMLFFVNEIRYHLGIANPKAYFAFSMLTVFFGMSDSVPRIIMSVTGYNGFTTSSITVLLCFELFVAVYAVIKLAGYLKDGMFIDKESTLDDYMEEEEYYQGIPGEADETSETDELQQNVDGDGIDGDGAEGTSETDENEDINASIGEDNTTEETVESGETVVENDLPLESDEVVADDLTIQDSSVADETNNLDDVNSSMMNFSDDVIGGNDLPDDSGFEGGNEGEFEVEGFAMVEDSSVLDDDDDDLDVDVHPLVAPDIDEAEFDNLIADEGEIIDYEELKSASVENINLENQAPDQDTTDDDDDDSVIDMDIMKVLSGDIEEENEADKSSDSKKENKKSFMQKFKFVKKM